MEMSGELAGTSPDHAQNIEKMAVQNPEIAAYLALEISTA